MSKGLVLPLSGYGAGPYLQTYIRFHSIMFIEPNIREGSGGWIEVICGSMFSGKTEELIRRLKRVHIANLQARIFKPMIDDRYHTEQIVSHDEQHLSAMPVNQSSEILALAGSAHVVGVDEAQFFDEGILEVCETLANGGARVIVAGLDMDYTGKPFGPMPGLLSIADYVTKLHAICMRCGSIAHYSHRTSVDEGQVVIGEKDRYEPLCRNCYPHRLK
jgi:thymidine kinase